MSGSSSTQSGDGLDGAINNGAGTALKSSGLSFSSFLASIATGAVAFTVQFLIFYFLRARLPRIYSPRTYLVPERDRVSPPRPGLIKWIIPLFKTPNAEYIQKCGLDSYFFLRYLYVLLRIFVPLALIILPILLPLNATGGKKGTSGLDIFGWQNITRSKAHRFWAHLILAVIVICYVCYIFLDELRNYVRLRQAYLTSPQHRLRASATTVLVTSIPRKWLTYEALDGLYDVFPGGVRNIWINRDFEELLDKVKIRDKHARNLEAAETELIKKARKKVTKSASDSSKSSGESKHTGSENLASNQLHSGDATFEESGISSGDPHQVPHNIDDALDEADGDTADDNNKKRLKLPISIPVVSHGVQLVGQGLDTIGRGVTRFGNKVAVGVKGGVGGLRDEVDLTLRRAEIGDGLVLDTGPESNRSDGDAIVQNRVDTVPRSETEAPSQKMRSDPTNTQRVPQITIDQSLSQSSSAEDRPIVRQEEDYHVPLDGARDKTSRNPWKFMNSTHYEIDSPQPQQKPNQAKEFPFDQAKTASHSDLTTPVSEADQRGKNIFSWVPFQNKKAPHHYYKDLPRPYNDEFERDEEDAVWRKYLRDSDRETMRLSLVPKLTWWPSLPFVGNKVDVIYHCRKELARLNQEIEDDQAHPERFPLMNSAFVQFNHQVAAHMACQTLSHHVPKHMAPRIVEISPDDVLWHNLSVKWWERYIRTGVVLLVVAGLTIAWAIPVTFTGLLSQVSYLSRYSWMAWLLKLPKWLISLVQGILPPILLAALLALLPLILRTLANFQGVPTGVSRELSVQNYYFGFLFVQVFLVVSISSGITIAIAQLTNSPTSAPQTLAQNLPKASNYFFSYMILQALSVSAGALLQVGSLVGSFILGPIFDSTARDKFTRNVKLSTVQWGTFFPFYTNLAAIGLIYSVISPLILIFNIVTFGLFWIVYRYIVLYVNTVEMETGGLLFPKAINQLFTGLYVMELCLIGLFFLLSETRVQAIIMVVVFVLTIVYQFLLNDAFSPLFRYVPITLEDDAVRRDEEFARAQSQKWDNVEEEGPAEPDIEQTLRDRERREAEDEQQAEEEEAQRIEEEASVDPHQTPLSTFKSTIRSGGQLLSVPGTWARRPSRPATNVNEQGASQQSGSLERRQRRRRGRRPTHVPPMTSGRVDLESQKAVGQLLFADINDEIEDLTPEERDRLVQRAFQHMALRARRPAVWIPRDNLGISDDEVRRTQLFSKKYIWISNEFAGLDAKARVVIRKSPPDFSEVDLIRL